MNREQIVKMLGVGTTSAVKIVAEMNLATCEQDRDDEAKQHNRGAVRMAINLRVRALRKW